MEEVWKDIYGYEGLYQVSNLGNIKRFYKADERISNGSSGLYRTVTLTKNGIKKQFAVHRLVATHFIPNPCPKELTEVNHKDGNKQNNSVENLEWVTTHDNVLHACTELGRGSYGKKARPVNMFDLETKQLLKTFNSVSDASREFENTHARISITQCCKGIYKQACGYYWQYAD